MNAVLEAWNHADPEQAASSILPCNGAQLWASRLAAQRPFASADDLLRAADAVWASLGEDAMQQAFRSHPRLGERKATAATAASLHWSAGEQSALAPEAAAQAALAQANQVYEQRFGQVFLVCATGKSTAEILSILQRRLANDPAAEMQEAAEQQRRITQLRLRKWLALPPAACEAV